MLSIARLACAEEAPPLLDARAVLQQIRQGHPGAATRESDAAKLLAEIHRFRSSAADLGPEKAAADWFHLLDGVTAIGAQPNFDPDAYDTDLRSMVGVRSVIGALPPPSAWPFLTSQAARRAALAHGDYHALSVELLAAVLLGDHAAVDSRLQAIDSAIASLPPAARLVPQRQVRLLHSSLVRLYGTPAQVANAFLEDVGNAADAALAGTGFNTIEVPDLVTLVGEPQATEILTKAISQPVALHVESGEATRALARRVALENINALRQPQWALVDSIDAAPLYEAMVHRFQATAQPTRGGEPLMNDARETADIYYLLFLIVNARQADAQKLLETLAAGDAVTIPKPAVDALQRAGRNDALYAFLGGVLVAHPEVRAWDVYLEQAAYTGHGREALAALDSVLRNKDLPGYLRSELQARRVDALLALGDTAHALPMFAELLRAPATAGDRSLGQRATAAIRVAGLGRVLGHPELETAGLRFAADALALPAEASANPFDRATLLRGLFAEARKEHRDAEAQRVAVVELTRHDANAEAMAREMDMVGMPGQWSTQGVALVELVSLYSAAHRPADARAILDEAQGWGGRDVRDIIKQKDSQDVPLALLAARVLAATGEPAAAVRLTKATIEQFPGYDGAYELESSIDPKASEVFDAQFHEDQFEGRPLIWNAVLLERAGRTAEAEKAVRAAITIDPSDGNEGVNDRMRAYAVLADILEAQGDAKSAAEYREVVAAIRISEKSDELHTLGLYQQAFAGYRDALQHFSDAYCIQSRLAVQLSQQGQHEQAAEHYRRAYELMPASFGRVESHCFGCESVFDGAQPQSIAEQVFQQLVAKEPRNPRVHYLQGYLFEEEGRYSDALPAFRTAVQIDGDYLNAWRHLNQIGSHIHLDAADRDVVIMKLLQLDPEQRHVTYDVGAAGDFRMLWNTVAEVARSRGIGADEAALYPLRESAQHYDKKQAELPPEMRKQVELYQALMRSALRQHAMPSPPLTLGRHQLLVQIGLLIGPGATAEQDD
ncbi:MAG: hypothetical protein ACLPQ6_08170 [Steroidobacteraceae bacterium]